MVNGIHIMKSETIRKKRIAFLLALFMVMGCLSGSGGRAYGAVTQEDQEAAGEFILIYNTGTDIGRYASSGTVAAASSAVCNAEAAALQETEELLMDILGKPVKKPAGIEDREFRRESDPRLRMSQSQNVIKDPLPGDIHTFNVQDYYGKRYDMKAEKMAEGRHCTIYVESANKDAVTADKAQTIVYEFENVIWDMMRVNFGDTLTDEHGRITILVHDIRDPEYYDGVRSYILGYFDPSEVHYYDDQERLHEGLPMFHIDIYPVMGERKDGPESVDVTRAFSTMTHEFQHLISYSDYWISPGQTSENSLWMDEMASMAAQTMYTGEPLNDRIRSFNNSSRVREGAPIIYKDYPRDGNLGADYGLPYVFGQYLRLQTRDLSRGGDQIFRTILQSNSSDEQAIIEALNGMEYETEPGSGPGYCDFGELNRNFRIATVLKEKEGLYGFRGDPGFDSVSHPISSSSAARQLAGTGAVVMALNGKTASVKGQGEGISYVVFSPDIKAQEAGDQVRVNGVTLRDKGGQAYILKKLENFTGELTLTMGVENLGNRPVMPVLYAGFYDENNRLRKVFRSDSPPTVESGQDQEVNLFLTGDGGPAGRVKILLLDEYATDGGGGGGRMEPLILPLE